MASKTFVTQKSLGPHAPGEVVTISDEDVKNGTDIQRLKDLEVIRDPEGDEKKATPTTLGRGADPRYRINPIPLPNDPALRGGATMGPEGVVVNQAQAGDAAALAQAKASQKQAS